MRTRIAQLVQPSPSVNSSHPPSTDTKLAPGSRISNGSFTSSANSPTYTTAPEARQIVQEELQREAKDLRKDFISIFGLFAAFLTFTVLQIQALIQTKRLALIIGAMAFFVASSLTFVLSLYNMIHEQNSWKEFMRPIFIIILIIFFFSFQCFWYATHGNKLWLFG